MTQLGGRVKSFKLEGTKVGVAEKVGVELTIRIAVVRARFELFDYDPYQSN